jgi:DNA polymerase III epsilon subunit-like protein
MRFLNCEIGKIYEKLPRCNPSLCTFAFRARLNRTSKTTGSTTLARFYSWRSLTHHRAADDAHATAHIFINLLEQLQIQA